MPIENAPQHAARAAPRHAARATPPPSHAALDRIASRRAGKHFLLIPLLGLPLLLLVAGAPVRAEEDLRARAEEAFQAGRYPEAIDLYRKIVASSPQDAFSLKRLALVLSWENRLDESIETYGKLLVVSPSDDEARAELAKVYGWSGRYGESEAAYRELLRRRPDDSSLKLGLAEVLGWEGKYGEAREIDEELVRRKDHAIEAAVGLGDLASWQGDLEGASRWYRQVLEADPDSERGAIGLARVHHWQGLDRAAVREIDGAVERFPKSRDARKLQREIRDALRTSVTPTFDRTIDTDGNDLGTTRLDVNFFSDPQTSFDLLYSHQVASFRCDSAGLCPGVATGDLAETKADSVAGVFGTRFGTFLSLGARLGADRLETFEGRGRMGLVGGASLDVSPSASFTVGAGYSHESLTETARLIQNDIRLDLLTARLDYRFARLWRLRGSAQHAWSSDGNERNVAFASLELRIPAKRPRLRASYSVRWLSYADDRPEELASGYFAPERYLSNLLTLGAGDELFGGKLYYSAEVTGGFQRFRPRPQTFATGSNDTVFGWNLIGGTNLSRRIAFEASFGRTDYAQQIASGFKSEHYGYLLKIRL